MPEFRLGDGGEAAHWYLPGDPPRAAYEILGKNGRWRPTTVRDAREYGLVPSVTTITRQVARPQLDRWRIRQAILAALTHPAAQTTRDYDGLIAMIEADAEEEARKAAEMGRAIHASIEGYFAGRAVREDHAPHVTAVIAELARLHAGPWEAERICVSELGYGGRVDLVAPGVVVDLKGQEFADASRARAYPEYGMQLAAYREALGMPQARCINVIFSRSCPGLVAVHEWDGDSLAKMWRAFFALLQYFRVSNGLE